MTFKEERFLIHPVGMYRVSKYWLFQLYEVTVSSMHLAWMRSVDNLIKTLPSKKSGRAESFLSLRIIIRKTNENTHDILRAFFSDAILPKWIF